jgi:hypothetical protein
MEEGQENEQATVEKQQPIPEATKCEQCRYYDITKKVYLFDCLGCTRYGSDLFEPREINNAKKRGGE